MALCHGLRSLASSRQRASWYAVLFRNFFLHVKVVLPVLAICILQSRRQLVPWWLSYHASKLVQVSCYDVRAGRVAERGEFPTLTVRWHRQQNNTAMLKTLP
jgi:hypothetical protein